LVYCHGGRVVIGVGLPVILVNVSYGFYSLWGRHGGDQPGEAVVLSLGGRLVEMLQLMMFGMIFCGPGVVVLGSAVFAVSVADARGGLNWRRVLIGAWVLGGLLAFLNLPGYMCLELLGNDPAIRALKVILLFLVAGVAAGTWIARVAWRVTHRQDSWLPAFSLTSLMGLMLVWAGIMAVFAPR